MNENHTSLSPSPQRTGKVLLIYTGGTIGMGRNPKTDALEPLDFSHLASKLPEFQYLKTSIETCQFGEPVDSSDIDPQIWARIVNIITKNYDNYDGFVILHGTDTMAYTASALSFMLENLTKPVILTGSQLPIGQLRTDGKENLVTSIELASAHHPDGRAMVPEVCIYFGGQLLRGNRATKQSADGFNAFATFNYPVLCHAGRLHTTYDATHRDGCQRHRNVAIPGYSGVFPAACLRGARTALRGHAHLRKRKCTPETMAHPTAQGGITPGSDHRQHKPVCVGIRRDEPLRHGLSTERCRRGEWARQYRRKRRHKTHVPTGSLRLPRNHPLLHEPLHLRRSNYLGLDFRR